MRWEGRGRLEASIKNGWTKSFECLADSERAKTMVVSVTSSTSPGKFLDFTKEFNNALLDKASREVPDPACHGKERRPFYPGSMTPLCVLFSI